MAGSRTETALAALSRLARAFDGGATRLSVSDLARECRLPAPFLAKTLTALAQAGVLGAQRGPGGGFWLARPPQQIRLREIVELFEDVDSIGDCRCLRAWCRSGAAPVQERVMRVRQAVAELLDTTTLATLCAADDAPTGSTTRGR